MSKKREFDSVSHSATGRTDTSKKGGHGTWGTNSDQIQQGKNDFANARGGPQGQGRWNRQGNDPENLRELNQVGAEAPEEEKVSFADFQKQAGHGGPKVVKPYAVNTKKGKKRNARNRTKAEKTTDMLFGGEYGGKNKTQNKKKNQNNKKNKNKNQNKNQNDKNKNKNRKAKEVLMTSVTYDAPDSRKGGRGGGPGGAGGAGGAGGYGGPGGRGRGRGMGRGRGRGRGMRGGYQNFGGWRGGRGGGGGFGSRGRGRRMEVNNNLNDNRPPNPHSGAPRQNQYRKVDPSTKGQNSNAPAAAAASNAQQ